MPPYHSTAGLFGAGDVLVDSAPAQPSGPPWPSLADPVNDHEAFFSSLAVAPSSSLAPTVPSMAPSDSSQMLGLQAPATPPTETSAGSSAAACTDLSSQFTSRTNSPFTSPLAASSTSSAPTTSPSSPIKSVDPGMNATVSTLASLSLSSPHPPAAKEQEEDQQEDGAIPFASSQDDNSVSSLFASSSADLFGYNGHHNEPQGWYQQQQQQQQQSQAQPAQHATTTSSSYLGQHGQHPPQQQVPDSNSASTFLHTQTPSTAHETASVTAPALIPTPAPESSNHAFFDSYSQVQVVQGHQENPQQQQYPSHTTSWAEHPHNMLDNSNATEFSHLNQTSSEQTMPLHEYTRGVQQQQQQQQLQQQQQQHQHTTPSPPAKHGLAPMASASSLSSVKKIAVRHRYPTSNQQAFLTPHPTQQSYTNPYEPVSSAPASLSPWQSQEHQDASYYNSTHSGYDQHSQHQQQQQPYGAKYASSSDPFLAMSSGQSFFARVGSSVTSTLAYTSTVASERFATASTRIAGLWQGHPSQQQQQYSHSSYHQQQQQQQQQGRYYANDQPPQPSVNGTLNSVSTGVTSISTSPSAYSMAQQQQEYGSTLTTQQQQQQTSYYSLDAPMQQSTSTAGYASYSYVPSQHHQQQQQEPPQNSYDYCTNPSLIRSSNISGPSGFSVATLSEAAAKAGAYLPSLSSVPLLNKFGKQSAQLPSMYSSSPSVQYGGGGGVGQDAESSTERTATYMSWPTGQSYQDNHGVAGQGQHNQQQQQQQEQQHSYNGYDAYPQTASYGGLSTTTTVVAGELWNGLRHEVQKGRRLVETGVQAGVAWWCNNKDPKIPV